MTYEQIQSLEIIEEHLSSSGCGYCTVSSLSEPGNTHRVYVNDKLYSVKCDCKGANAGYDCGHRVAVDRYLDSRRDERKRLAKYDVVAAALAVVNQARADAQVGDFYEQRARDIERSRYLAVALQQGWE